jgi:tetratricopeptide (TPR) repeat protein
VGLGRAQVPLFYCSKIAVAQWELDLGHASRFMLFYMPRLGSWVPSCCCGVLLALVSVHAVLGQSPAKNATKATPEDSLNRHYQAARTFSVVGDTDHAAVEYRAFLGEALHGMANARINEGNYAAGYQLFDEAVGVVPDDVGLRLDYGNALLQQGNADKAKIQAQKAVELQPQNSKAEYLLGRAFFEQADYKAAGEHLEKAVKEMAGDITFEVGYDLATTYPKGTAVARLRHGTQKRCPLFACFCIRLLSPDHREGRAQWNR